MTNHIGAVYVFMILNNHDQSDQLPTVTKTRQDNYVINSTDVVYAKKESDMP